MPLPPDYAERVYAGVLGKLVGVYLGRPFEQWTYEQITERLGEITGYVTGHPAIEPAKRDNPLVLTDDDVSGTFTFPRALEDYGFMRDVSPAQIGQWTWPRDELAIDVSPKALYSLVTGAITDALVAPAPASSARRRALGRRLKGFA